MNGSSAFVAKWSCASNTSSVRKEREGNATHLGRFAVTGDVALDVVTGIPLGTWTLTAANGDKLFLTMGGHGIDATHGFGAFTVVGGSGRFLGTHRLPGHGPL